MGKECGITCMLISTNISAPDVEFIPWRFAEFLRVFPVHRSDRSITPESDVINEISFPVIKLTRSHVWRKSYEWFESRKLSDVLQIKSRSCRVIKNGSHGHCLRRTRSRMKLTPTPAQITVRNPLFRSLRSAGVEDRAASPVVVKSSFGLGHMCKLGCCWHGEIRRARQLTRLDIR